MFSEADSVHVKLKTLYNVVNTPENLFAAEYIPFCAIPITADIIVLSDALTIHHEIIFGINGTEYFIISFKIFLSNCFGFMYL